ncbi:helix-turn-helix domain-containing protein [Thalassospira alkalitolerans]|uniref:helix-turn-helix domain-containing protein n=1 Tax=Thalassospira alkalitolerans TaxID=1293890 RepID=UPI003AA812E3
MDPSGRLSVRRQTSFGARHFDDPVPVTTQAIMDRFDPSLSAQDWVMNDPGRRDRCYAVLMLSGRAHIRLRQGTIECRAPALVWLPLGETQAVSVAAGAKGYFLSVVDDLVARHCGGGGGAVVGSGGVTGSGMAQMVVGLGGGLPLRFAADTVHNVTPAEGSDNLALLARSFDAIRAELLQNALGASTVVGAHLQIILTMVLRLAEGVMEQRDKHRPGSITFQRFLQVLELHFREHWNVADYAGALGVSERRLGSAVMRATGKAPLTLIHERILREACMRLEQSPLGVAQIAYGLGFRDPAYFSRFFKRYMGEAPGAYRRLRRAEERVRDDTFAAWP